ncbi:uncharacterized protein AMSG_11107 [Thecamonas trahens ATCC 50062]|uniref:Uncharacterized protein n=1 Tax=Thecamonas trahens ATCC 50062 TaxID=461836 RepID=A0A0L0DSW7_THETB|nr:hypothetical protein AMSG_11107 [Thecamonas trahens ATCC 50062]KNC55444.1 hypothetical protein AMSG_11107 [Thecamonas trahens ATCC 50062]|eukprot:XP_013752981.1 hypothetical protein AMSG_11107 [Thecamonas trahens ATCC 50062]
MEGELDIGPSFTSAMETVLAVMGPMAVGKSALTVRYNSGHFVDNYEPTLEDSYRKTIVLDGRSLVVYILDTAGSDQFSYLRDQYLKKGHGFIFVFSLTARASLLELDDFIQQLRFCRESDSLDGVTVLVVGNKADLTDQREVSEEEGRAKAEELGCAYMETSAKSGDNVREAFETVIRGIVDNRPASRPPSKKWCTLL